MAYEQNFQDPLPHFETEGELSLKQTLELNSDPAIIPENSNGCFDCNICLDSAHDPVVTLCGHLYCWPCIFKWLHVQTSSSESNEHPKCPVCKANISKSSLIPLYGRGSSSTESNSKRFHRDVVPPRRPPDLELHTTVASGQHQQQLHHLSQPFHYQHYFPQPYGNYASMSSSNSGGPAMTMFGEMVFARMFGSSDTNLFAYPFLGNGSPRLRRQEMEVEKSLNRITFTNSEGTNLRANYRTPFKARAKLCVTGLKKLMYLRGFDDET